ncbi:MAG: hypothetical protein ACH349_07590, partial [Candidatus Rhabdochlamydia sp.]
KGIENYFTKIIFNPLSFFSSLRFCVFCPFPLKISYIYWAKSFLVEATTSTDFNFKIMLIMDLCDTYLSLKRLFKQSACQIRNEAFLCVFTAIAGRQYIVL